VLYQLAAPSCSQLTDTTWTVRGLGETAEELDKTLNENNTKISVITESKQNLQGTTETEDYISYNSWS
jgi:hypothetical protein